MAISENSKMSDRMSLQKIRKDVEHVKICQIHVKPLSEDMSTRMAEYISKNARTDVRYRG